MRIFITGATGFIGSHVAYRLLRAGHQLVALARNPEKTPSLSTEPNVERITGTLYDTDLIRQKLRGCDACVHIALGWGDEPLSMLQTDTTATVSLLEACLSAEVEQFLYTSSTATYGPFSPRMNEDTPLKPSDYYGATKAASEAYVLAVAAKRKMRCNIIRPGYTFGNPVVEQAPTQPDRRFNEIAASAAAGTPIEVSRGDGTQFVAADDLASLYEAVLGSKRNRETYLGLATPFVTWQAVAELAIRLTQSKSQVLAIGDGSPPCLFDLSKIHDHFGLEFESAAAITAHLEYLIKQAAEPGVSSDPT